MVSTVRPNAKATPRNPMPRFGNAAAKTALPQPPNTSQNVPKNSATTRLDMSFCMALGFLPPFLPLYRKLTDTRRFSCELEAVGQPVGDRTEAHMFRILLSAVLCLYVGAASAADRSCASQAAEKKLAGAAKQVLWVNVNATRKLDAMLPLLRRNWQ